MATIAAHNLVLRLQIENPADPSKPKISTQKVKVFADSTQENMAKLGNAMGELIDCDASTPCEEILNILD